VHEACEQDIKKYISLALQYTYIVEDQLSRWHS